MSETSKTHKIPQKQLGKSLIRKRRRVSSDFDYDPQAQSWILINQSQQELHKYIDHLDHKINQRLEHQQNKIAFAYQNHLKKVTKQLRKLKELHDFNQQKFSSDQAITHLTKQCVLFRQEAIRLHSQLEDAVDELDIYRRKSELLDSEVRKTNLSLKNMMKIVKQLQGKKIEMEETLRDKQETINRLLHQSQTNTKAILLNQPQQKIFETREEQEENFQTPTKLLKHTKKAVTRPVTTQNNHQQQSKSRFKGRKDRALDLEPFSYLNNGGIFTNSKITQFYSTTHQKQIKSGRLDNRRVNTHNSFKDTHRNTNPDEFSTTYIGDQQKSYTQLKANELELFNGLLSKIQEARDDIIKNKISHFVRELNSKDTVGFLFNDAEVAGFLSIIFRGLNIQIQQSGQGTRFIAHNKKSNKSLAQLSSQLMKKFKLKRFQTEASGEQPNIKQELSSIKMQELLKQQNKHEYRFYRMDRAFTKKSFAKTHRLPKYKSNQNITAK